MSKVFGSQPRDFPSSPAGTRRETNTKHLLSSWADNSVWYSAESIQRQADVSLVQAINVLGIKDYIVWSQTGHGYSHRYQICTVLSRPALGFSFCFRIWEVLTRYCALGWSGSGWDERKRTRTPWPPRCCTHQSRGLKSKRVGAATTAPLGGWCCFIFRNVISSCLYKRVHVLIIKER